MDQYGELDEGALDGEDIEGGVDGEGERMEQLLNETEENRRTERQNILREKEAMRRLITLQVTDLEISLLKVSTIVDYLIFLNLIMIISSFQKVGGGPREQHCLFSISTINL